jgi:predicted nucleotidyltransferase
MVFQQVNKIGNFIAPSTLASIVYHNVFDFPLTSGELIRWEVSEKYLKPFHLPKDVNYQKGYYFIKGREGLLLKRALRKRIFPHKYNIALNAAKLLSKIKWIKGVFLTGSIAMENGDINSDIDIMVVVESGRLWTSRILSYILLYARGLKGRRYASGKEKDRLCLNMWLDESNLAWPEKDRNIFTAHEMLQVKPLLNKDNVFEKLLKENNWAKSFWPNAYSLKGEYKRNKKKPISGSEKLFYELQKKYMKGKITIETVSLRRAIFHPTVLWPPIAHELKTKGFKL